MYIIESTSSTQSWLLPRPQEPRASQLIGSDSAMPRCTLHSFRQTGHISRLLPLCSGRCESISFRQPLQKVCLEETRSRGRRCSSEYALKQIGQPVTSTVGVVGVVGGPSGASPVSVLHLALACISSIWSRCTRTEDRAAASGAPATPAFLSVRSSPLSLQPSQPGQKPRRTKFNQRSPRVFRTFVRCFIWW